jgi:hypothetical protein
VIYFIEHAGLIKIGFASNVEKRLTAFRTTLPALKLIGTMDGTRGHERTIHDCLAIHRQGGEWFTDCDEVRGFIAAATADGVKEWKSNRTKGYKPSMWDARAQRLSEIICKYRPKADLRSLEKELSLPAGCLWNTRYRLSKEISVGQYFSLLTAARETVRQEMERLNIDSAFVSDLEREDAETTNATVDAERWMAAVSTARDVVAKAGEVT